MESASQMAVRLMKEIATEPKEKYTKGEVRTILNVVSQAPSNVSPTDAIDSHDVDGTCRAPTKTDDLQRGDVFIHKLVGGKVRPWIVLRVTDDVVTAVGVSSGDSAPNMILSKCRFWPGNWIGTTVTQVRLDDAAREVTRPYSNRRHLREIEEHVADCMGMSLAPENTTLKAIAGRMGAA